MTVFKNVDMLSEMVQDHDDPIIKYLQDITLKLTEEPMVCVIATEFSKDNGKTCEIAVPVLDNFSHASFFLLHK